MLFDISARLQAFGAGTEERAYEFLGCHAADDAKGQRQDQHHGNDPPQDVDQTAGDGALVGIPDPLSAFILVHMIIPPQVVQGV